MANEAPIPPVPPPPPAVLTGEVVPPPRQDFVLPDGDPEAGIPPLRIHTGRCTLPWEEILASYLTPIVTEDGMVAKWPTLRDLSVRFNCSHQSLLDASSEEGWGKRQKLARKFWTSERTENLNDQMVEGAAMARMASYQNGLSIINKATAALKTNGDMPAVIRAAVATEKGLDIVMKCAGVPSVPAGSQLGVMVAIQQNVGTEGGAPVGGAPAGNLWTILVEGRRFTPPPVDPFDAPSPLPPSLASR